MIRDLSILNKWTYVWFKILVNRDNSVGGENLHFVCPMYFFNK
jgi:hypothetical protein